MLVIMVMIMIMLMVVIFKSEIHFKSVALLKEEKPKVNFRYLFPVFTALSSH